MQKAKKIRIFVAWLLFKMWRDSFNNNTNKGRNKKIDLVKISIHWKKYKAVKWIGFIQKNSGSKAQKIKGSDLIEKLTKKAYLQTLRGDNVDLLVNTDLKAGLDRGNPSKLIPYKIEVSHHPKTEDPMANDPEIYFFKGGHFAGLHSSIKKALISYKDSLETINFEKGKAFIGIEKIYETSGEYGSIGTHCLFIKQVLKKILHRQIRQSFAKKISSLQISSLSVCSLQNTLNRIFTKRPYHTHQKERIKPTIFMSGAYPALSFQTLGLHDCRTIENRNLKCAVALMD